MAAELMYFTSLGIGEAMRLSNRRLHGAGVPFVGVCPGPAAPIAGAPGLSTALARGSPTMARLLLSPLG